MLHIIIILQKSCNSIIFNEKLITVYLLFHYFDKYIVNSSHCIMAVFWEKLPCIMLSLFLFYLTSFREWEKTLYKVHNNWLVYNQNKIINLFISFNFKRQNTANLLVKKTRYDVQAKDTLVCIMIINVFVSQQFGTVVSAGGREEDIT